MKKKIFISFILVLFLLSTTIFGMNVKEDEIDKDLYISENNYLLSSKVSGNVFLTVKDFVVNDNVIIDGDLFVVANTVTLKSNVTYLDAISKDGKNAIDKINSHATIQGSAYIVCKELTLEPGVEISGDLYVVAQKIDMQKSSSVDRNVFATANTFELNGRIHNSVYASTQNFSMNYFGSIDKDLDLASNRVNLSSVIHRETNIDADIIETTSSFISYGNININTDIINYSGETHGNASIKANELNFINTSTEEENTKCLIQGDLTYSTPKELTVDDSIITGEINYSKNVQKDTNNHFNIKSFILSLITFVLYVFVIVWLFKLFAKDYTEKDRAITVKNCFVDLGIGLLSIIVVILAAILLLITNIGSTLSFVLLFAYILVLFLSTPLFVLDIVKMIKTKINFYLMILVIALALFLISKIPVIGGIVSFLFVIIGTGRIIKNLIRRNKEVKKEVKKEVMKETNN